MGDRPRDHGPDRCRATRPDIDRVRATGYPATPDGQVFAATGYVEPADDHLASIMVDTADKNSWTSTARAQWLVPEHAPLAKIGDIITVTEGARPVAHLTISEIDRS